MTATIDDERAAPPAAAVAPRPHPRVVTVFSAKGGAGSTMLAVNLALALRRSGARVCLVDLALAFGDVAVSLQLAPRRSLVDALEVGTSMASVTELVTVHDSGLHCVLSPVDPTGLEKVPPDVVRRLISSLRDSYDVVLVDTASELSEHVLEAIDASDRLLLVTTPEIPSIKNTRIALDMLDLVGHPREQCRIVLNQFDGSLGISVDDVEGALQTSAALTLPVEREVALSVNGGVPIVSAHPDNPLSVAVSDFAAREIRASRELVIAERGSRFRLRRRSA